MKELILKHKAIVLIICIGVFIGVIGVSFGMRDKKIIFEEKDIPQTQITLVTSLEFEINCELELLSLIDNIDNGIIVSEEEIIDTSILGIKNIIIRYLNENNEENDYHFEITIVDTIAPVIEFKKELITTQGTKIDLLKNVKVIDNSKEEIKATVHGEFNFEKVGTYSLKYIAVDSSGNKTEEEFTLKVNKKPVSNNSNATNNSNSNNNENKPTTKLEDFAAEVFRLVNIEREKQGIPKLKQGGSALVATANLRAKEIQTLFSHTRPNGEAWSTALDGLMGENLAKGYMTPIDVVKAWMESTTGHKENILNSYFTYIGVGVQESGGIYYWVQLFM